MSELFKAVLFGIVEGITEWLPISSTGHLILLNEFVTLNMSEAFGSKYYNAIIGAFTAALQLGIAVSNPAIGTLMNYSGQNPYTLPFSVMIFVNVIGMVLVFTALIKKPMGSARK